MRILHFPTLIGAHPPALAAEERRLGHESICVADIPSPFDVACDEILLPQGGGLLARARARRRAARRLRRTGGFDVVHFNGGQSALNRYGFALDVPAWKARGVKVFVTFQGTDARPMSTLRSPRDHPLDPWRDRMKRLHVHRFARLADATFVLNPDLLEWVPGSQFVPYASIDHRLHGVGAGSQSDRLRVVHAPSKRWIKGTEFVLDARSTLDADRYDWRLLEGVTQAEVGRELDTADVAVDQFRLGWYGAFSLEAMTRGVPTICWIDPVQLERVPACFREGLPIVCSRGEELAGTLETLRRDPGLRSEIGRRSREFAVRFHDPRRIAAAIVSMYESRSTDFWGSWNHQEPSLPTPS